MTQGRYKKLQDAEEKIYELEQTVRELYLEVDYLNKIINGEESFLEFPSEELDRDKQFVQNTYKLTKQRWRV